MSEIKSILLHLDAAPRSAARLRLAAELAERHDATVTAAYAATPAAMAAALAVAEGSGLLVPAAADIDDEYKRRACRIFDDTRAGPRVSWTELAGAAPLPSFVQAALTSDLLVLGQYDRSEAGSRIVPADFAEAVIIESGKPAIVVPYAGDFTRSVAPFWSPGSARESRHMHWPPRCRCCKRRSRCTWPRGATSRATSSTCCCATASIRRSMPSRPPAARSAS